MDHPRPAPVATRMPAQTAAPTISPDREPSMPSHPIPTLTTDRLILRAPVAADFPDFARLMASPRAAYMGGPYTKPAAWGLFCHDIACWHLFGHGGLMIDQRATGECVGSVGIHHG